MHVQSHRIFLYRHRWRYWSGAGITGTSSGSSSSSSSNIITNVVVCISGSTAVSTLRRTLDIARSLLLSPLSFYHYHHQQQRRLCHFVLPQPSFLRMHHYHPKQRQRQQQPRQYSLISDHRWVPQQQQQQQRRRQRHSSLWMLSRTRIGPSLYYCCYHRTDAITTALSPWSSSFTSFTATDMITPTITPASSSQPSQPTPTLTLWKQMISSLPLHWILPSGMASQYPTSSSVQEPSPSNDTTIGDIADRAAFYGDKILNYYISQVLRQQQQQQQEQLESSITVPSETAAVLFRDDAVIGNQLIPATKTATELTTATTDSNIASTHSGMDLGYVTLVQSEAMSNRLYSNLFQDIMGSHPQVTADIIQHAQARVHDAAIMIDAAVDAIMNPTQSDDDPNHATITPTLHSKADAIAAIQELATFLVYNAYQMTTYFNAKGQLLELGGTVISFKTEDSALHTPKFRAIATFREMSYLSDPPTSTKKLAEQMAATHLLQQCQQLRKQPGQKVRATEFTNTDTDTAHLGNETTALTPINDSTTGTTLATAKSRRSGDIDIVAFDPDLMDDGALPDDFYSDISTITNNNANDDENNNDDDHGFSRPYDAQRFQLPKLQKKTQGDFYHFTNTHTVNLKRGESPELSWRRGAYEQRVCFHRAVLASKMLPQYVETVNSWTRPQKKDLYTVVVVLVPKQKPEDFQKSIFPTVKCFVRHDTSRNRARNALGLVVNQYIDQVIIGSDMMEIQKSNYLAPVQPDRKLWPPSKVRDKPMDSTSSSSSSSSSSRNSKHRKGKNGKNGKRLENDRDEVEDDEHIRKHRRDIRNESANQEQDRYYSERTTNNSSSYDLTRPVEGKQYDSWYDSGIDDVLPNQESK